MAGYMRCLGGGYKKGPTGGMKRCDCDTYYKFRQCSDGVEVDIGATAATILAMAVTGANSIKYGGVCYYLGSTTTTAPGTVAVAGDLTKYNCCDECVTPGSNCCGPCANKKSLTVILSDFEFCCHDAGSPWVRHLFIGDPTGVYNVPIYPFGSTPGQCMYQAGFTGIMRVLTDQCESGAMDATLAIVITVTSTGMHVTISVGSSPILNETLSGEWPCDGGTLTVSNTVCSLSYAALAGKAVVI